MFCASKCDFMKQKNNVKQARAKKKKKVLTSFFFSLPPPFFLKEKKPSAVTWSHVCWPTGCTWFSVARYCKQLLQSTSPNWHSFLFSTLKWRGGKKKVLKIKPALRGRLTASVWSLRRAALFCRRVKITCDSLVAQFSSEMHFPFGPRAGTFAQLRDDIPATCDSRRSGRRPAPATLTLADCAAARRWFAGCPAG